MWLVEWIEFRMIGVPLKLLQTASRVDTILKRYDKEAPLWWIFRKRTEWMC